MLNVANVTAFSVFYLLLHFSVFDDLFSAGNWTVINDSCLITSSILHMPIDSIITHVQLSSNKPGTKTEECLN